MFADPLNFTTRRVCKACGLYLNQLPVLDKRKKSSVFWVGLSSVLISAEEENQPLSPKTRTGSLIKKVEDVFNEKISFYKTNIVKCLPLNNNKIRYPNKSEMEKCYPNLVDEVKGLNPRVIFLLGKQVASFVLGKHNRACETLDEEFFYKVFKIDNMSFIPIHHPSYILIYKRKLINHYIKSLSSIIDECILDESLCEV